MKGEWSFFAAIALIATLVAALLSMEWDSPLSRAFVGAYVGFAFGMVITLFVFAGNTPKQIVRHFNEVPSRWIFTPGLIPGLCASLLIWHPIVGIVASVAAVVICSVVDGPMPRKPPPRISLPDTDNPEKR